MAVDRESQNGGGAVYSLSGKNRIACLFPVFCLLMAWFYWGSPWYPAAKAHVSGVVATVPSQLVLRWTSAHGLNGYEMNKYLLQSLPVSPGRNGLTVKVTRTGVKHPAAAGSNVLLKTILVDGKKFIPPARKLGGIAKYDGDFIVLKKKKKALAFQVKPVRHLRLEFLAFNTAGEVAVDVGGKISRHNLYSAWDLNKWSLDNIIRIDYWLVSPDGRFSVSMDMPRYPVKTFQVESKSDFSVTSLVINTEDGERIEAVGGVSTPGAVTFRMDESDEALKRFFHPQRLALQIVFALFSTWLLYGIIAYVSRFHGPRDVFYNRKRYLFWGMLLFSMAIFAFWHISFWPGVASTDSLKIWRAAHIPGMYLGDHPPLNVIVYQYLIHLWDNIAVVPFIQNLLAALLIAYIYFSLYRWRLPLAVLAPCFLFTALSLPLGLYTIILWKDVPFALLTVFLGFRLADFYYQKRTGSLRVTRQTWIVLLLLTCALAGLRYNGAIYLIVVPLLLLGMRVIVIPVRYFRIGVAWLVLAGAAVAALWYFIPSSPSYFASQSGAYIKQAGERLSFDYIKERREKYLGVFDVNQTERQWDHVHNCLYGRFNNNFLRRVGWNDVYSYLPLPRLELQKKMARTAMYLYKKSYREPWVYFSWNPFYMLLLLPILPLFVRRLPMTAVFSFFVLIQVVALVFLDIFNWRYYFFAFFASYFLVPLVITDLTRRKALS